MQPAAPNPNGRHTMMSSHITYQAQLSRISELHRQAAAMRLAHEAKAGPRAGKRMVLVRWLSAIYKGGIQRSPIHIPSSPVR